jgi:hypothetical protein
MMPGQTIIMLASESTYTNIIFHTLAKEFQVDCVIIESKSFGSSKRFLMNRVRKLGLQRVLGQMLFVTLCVPLMRVASRKRILEIANTYHLDFTRIDR